MTASFFIVFVYSISFCTLKAQAFADNEKDTMQGLVLHAVELQMKRIDSKLKYVEALESLLRNGHSQLDKQRNLLMKDRQRFCMQMIDCVEQMKKTNEANLVMICILNG